MMPTYPFFGFPNFRRPYPNYSPYYPSHHASVNSNKNRKNPYFPSTFSKEQSENFAYSSSLSHSTKNEDSNRKNTIKDENISEECFEIFGLKLYFDDLLIIALLFFLYQEEVKDTYLYIALILLLLS